MKNILYIKKIQVLTFYLHDINALYHKCHIIKCLLLLGLLFIYAIKLIYYLILREPAFGFKESKIHYNFINYFTLKLCKPTFKFSSIFFHIYRSSFLYLFLIIFTLFHLIFFLFLKILKNEHFILTLLVC